MHTLAHIRTANRTLVAFLFTPFWIALHSHVCHLIKLYQIFFGVLNG